MDGMKVGVGHKCDHNSVSASFLCAVSTLRTSAMEELGLEGEGLTACDLKRIFDKLGAPEPTRVSRPRKCRKYDEGIQAILAQIYPQRRIRSLVLDFNPIGDAGIHHIVSLLPSSIIELRLTFCSLTSRGISALCKFLETDKTVRKLWCMGNEFGDEGAETLT